MILRIQQDDIRPYQGHGDRFTELVDLAIRAAARAAGVPDAEVHTNLHVSIPDGGVDTRVAVPLPGETSGRFAVQTVWQYKATPRAHVRPHELFVGPYVREKLLEGYGFRLAVADSYTPQDKEALETDLNARVAAINPAAPPAMVVTADDLAEWISGYPALVFARFRQANIGHVQHLHAWGRNELQLTPRYVPVPMWEGMEDRLLNHVDFGQTPPESILVLQGASGVGKTRLVYETLRKVEGAEALVLYTRDPIPLAHYLSNHSHLRCVVVADECSLSTRHELTGVVGGHRDRVRVIAIDNEQVHPLNPAPELRLQRMDDANVEEVLRENFPEVSSERRRAYAHLAKGFPRFAADLCRHDQEIQAAGHAGAAMPTARGYLETRFPDQASRDALAMTSMFTKLGFREGQERQLEAACGLVGMEPRLAQSSLRRLHETTGFIARGGRFYYVTPELVADVAFEIAWQEWIRDDPPAFLSRIPSDLQKPFLDRVAQLPNEEVRRVCGDYFRAWAERLNPDTLSSLSAVEEFITLIETDPSTYFPALKRIVQTSTAAQLQAEENTSGTGRWGPRRQLVWLCERMAQLPEHFSDAEEVLYRLALAESEPAISNNATGVWKQLFHVTLSGTPVSFLARIELLRSRLNQAEGQALIVDALKEVLRNDATRVLGPAVVAGRIPPAEWRPTTWEELRNCYRAAAELLITVAEGTDETLSLPAAQALMESSRRLLNEGVVDVVERIAGLSTKTRSLQATLLESLDIFLKYDAKRPKRGTPERDYVDRVIALRNGLTGRDFASRLTISVASSPWSPGRNDDKWKNELTDLARHAIQNQAELSREFEWLFSDEAQSAAEFGEAVGREDAQAALLSDILMHGSTAPNRAFARGYAYGLLSAHPSHAAAVAGWLDRHQMDAPELAAELVVTRPEELAAVDRTLVLYDQRLLGPGALHAMRLFPHWKEADPQAVGNVLSRLAHGVKAKLPGSTRVLLDSLLFLAHRSDELPERLFGRADIQDAAWVALEEGDWDEVRSSGQWADLLRGMAKFDPTRSIKLASKIAVSEVWALRSDAEEVLSDLAAEHPETLMEEFGQWAFDENRGWVFFLADFKSVLWSLPVDVVKRWVTTHGVKAARAIARHVPGPAVVDGQPHLRELTEWLLTEFGDDDRVFSEFCAGINNMKSYWGDLSRHLEAEAAVADAFVNHPIARLREWAVAESRSAREQARRERIRSEEFDLP